MAEYCDSFDFSEINQDHYEMVQNETDSFQFWQGLRGPYYTPFVGEDGYLYWSNTGQLPNPEPVRIVGKDGRGITLTGQCETVSELPEDPEQGEAWAVGEEEPFECYAWFGEWVDMGLLLPAGQDGVSPTVTISATATGHKVKITDRDHPSGQEFNVDDGDPGQDGISPAVTITATATGHKVKITDRDHPSGQEFNVDDGDPGQDGISPAVTITTTATGHKVKITDRDHPSGQEFNVDDGEDGDPGPGVPAGGSAGQFYRKASGTDYDGEWHTLSAGDSSYDSSLTYPSGTVGQELSSQRNTLNSVEDSLETTDKAIAVVVDGNKSDTGASVSDFVIVKNSTIAGITDGIYVAKEAIPANTVIDKTYFYGTSPFTKGAVNELKDRIEASVPYAIMKASTELKGVAMFTPDYSGWCTLELIPQGTSSCYFLLRNGGVTIGRLDSTGGSSTIMWVYVDSGRTYTTVQSASSTISSATLYYWVK
jgi:hypothetical protein